MNEKAETRATFRQRARDFSRRFIEGLGSVGVFNAMRSGDAAATRRVMERQGRVFDPTGLRTGETEEIRITRTSKQKRLDEGK